MIGEPCPHCPALPGQICPRSLWRRGCPVAKEPDPIRRGLMVDGVRRELAFVGRSDVDASRRLGIERCAARESDCNCLGRPATCRRDGTPRVVVCLREEWNGAPCAGVTPDYTASPGK